MVGERRKRRDLSDPLFKKLLSTLDPDLAAIIANQGNGSMKDFLTTAAENAGALSGVPFVNQVEFEVGMDNEAITNDEAKSVILKILETIVDGITELPTELKVSNENIKNQSFKYSNWEYWSPFQGRFNEIVEMTRSYWF